jgi:hypothetical protein
LPYPERISDGKNQVAYLTGRCGENKSREVLFFDPQHSYIGVWVYADHGGFRNTAIPEFYDDTICTGDDVVIC